jgi:hypothetical protein
MCLNMSRGSHRLTALGGALGLKLPEISDKARRVLRYVDSLLGNDHEISKYTTASTK